MKLDNSSLKRGLGFGILFACAAAWVLVQSSLAMAAADPSTELKTAIDHAGYSAKSEALTQVHMHLHHTLNCLVGPQDKLFDAAAGNPCNGQGNGYLPDSKAAMPEGAAYYDALWAKQIAVQAIASNNLAEAKAGARAVVSVLENAAKAK
jgi:hypothetical protein